MQSGNSPLSKGVSNPGEIGMAQKPVAQHTFLRGRNLLEQPEFESSLNSVRPYWDGGIQLGPFRLPTDDATKHIALVGAPGSGKTVVMRLLMQSVLPLVGQNWKGGIPEAQVRASLASALTHTLPTPPAVTPINGDAANDDSSRERICEELLSHFNGNKAELLGALQSFGEFAYFYMFVAGFILFLFGAGAFFAVLGPWCIVTGLALGLPIGIGATKSVTQNRRTIEPFLRRLGPQGMDIIRRFAEGRPLPAIPSQQQVVETTPGRSAPAIYDGPLEWGLHRALVYDAKLEVIPQLEGMGLRAPIVVLNPFDKRSVAWDMAADITEPAIAKQIASIFIPDEKKASQPFFSDAARQLLEGVMVAFILTRPQQWTLRDVLVALKSGTRLSAVLSSTPSTKDLVETYLSNERETKSIIATIATKLGPFDVVAALWDAAESKVSLRDWLHSESILVLGNDEAYRSSLDVINQVIFKRIVELLLAQPATSMGRTWFFLDEVKEAGNLDALGRLMTKGRSVGASVVLGFQDVDGMYEAFGENQAKSILGQCATKLFLRLDSPETAKWAESVFGEYEAVEVKQSASLGESTSEGTSTTKGSSTTDGTSSGKSTTWNGLDRSTSTNSGTSESYSTSESTAQSSTTGQNRSVTQAADIAKRSVILAAQFQNLPMTSVGAGVNGFLAHHLGATPFKLMGFESLLRKDDSSSSRVLYREGGEQFLKLWTPEEEAAIIPPAAATTEVSPAGTALRDAQSRYKKGRFLPGTDAENGLRRRDN
jgi:Cdc6-like AAA superfamily ATPase